MDTVGCDLVDFSGNDDTGFAGHGGSCGWGIVLGFGKLGAAKNVPDFALVQR